MYLPETSKQKHTKRRSGVDQQQCHRGELGLFDLCLPETRSLRPAGTHRDSCESLFGQTATAKNTILEEGLILSTQICWKIHSLFLFLTIITLYIFNLVLYLKYLYLILIMFCYTLKKIKVWNEFIYVSMLKVPILKSYLIENSVFGSDLSYL